MIFYLLLSVVLADEQCFEQSVIQMVDPIDAIGQEYLLISLYGEYLIGYGSNYEIRDKTKIQVMPSQEPSAQSTDLSYKASTIEVYCPPRHIVPENDGDFDAECEIAFNLFTLDKSQQTYAQLIILIEEDDEIRTNPLFKIDTDLELHLSDLADQLDMISVFYTYTNCGINNYIIPEPIEITADQMISLKKYGSQLPADYTTSAPVFYSGTLRIENYTTNKNSKIHLYGLIAIIAGVLILTAIRAFKKRDEQQQQDKQQQQEDQYVEMPKLG